jgi:hypothetical protein
VNTNVGEGRGKVGERKDSREDRRESAERVEGKKRGGRAGREKAITSKRAHFALPVLVSGIVKGVQQAELSFLSSRLP